MATGYIRDNIDMKFIILHVLGAMGGPATRDEIWSCIVSDETAGYFMFCDMADELSAQGLVIESDGMLSITRYGEDTCALYENRLPYSVRVGAMRAAMSAASKRKRDESIICATQQLAPDEFVTTLELRDGQNRVMKIELATASAAQSSLIENNFRAGAENVFNTLLRALVKPSDE